MTRLNDNLAILARLDEHLRANPDIRFGQALRNLGVVEQIEASSGQVVWRDGFNEEPAKTLHRMKDQEKR